MSNFRTYTITIGDVYNGTEKCENPIVTIAGQKDIALNCIDAECGIYTVQVGPGDEDPCITFIVQCEECDVCPPQIIEKCFCDTIDDCEDCEDCIGGFCEKVCDKCCNGQCCDCETDADCPCNQKCINGNCGCDPTTSKDCDGDGNLINDQGCCDECCLDGDCDVCEICVEINGAQTCIPKDCGDGQCDITGKCGEPGECVECINSGGCPQNECCTDDCKCDCCPGYTRVNGVCIPAACVTDDDCGDCEFCQNNRCIPQRCPDGQVPVLPCDAGPGDDCVCATICDCSNSNCPAGKYCAPSVFSGICGCIDCCGDCTAGCEDPCVCEGTICVEDPCQNQPCDNGTNCPEGCGCLDGQCVSCSSLDCTGPDCERALGCGCNAQNECESNRGCPPTPCAIADDCPKGCTCFEGVCTDCSLFPCPTQCAEQDNCICVGGNCVGDDPGDCTDIITLEKDDENCTLTGELKKNNCCSCSALTLAIKNAAVSVGADTANLTFSGEIRKGAFDGISVDAKPLVDNFTHPDIAENEPPTSGTFQLAYTIGYDVFDIIDGERFYAGFSEDAPITSSASFNNVGQVTFNQASVPVIGAEFDFVTQIKVVSLIRFEFIVIESLRFPNDCVYDSGQEIASFTILDNGDFNNLIPQAVTATSDECRKPLFKWTKSTDANFNEQPFRKIYAEESTVNTWTDVLTKDEGLESCYYYLFDPDCTCNDSLSKYIVFCNPADIEYELANCNTRLTIKEPFEPCDVNEDVIYRIQAGTIDRTFTAADVPFTETSANEIEEIIYSIVCDAEGQCTKTYEVTPEEYNVQVITECQNQGSEFVASFVPDPGCDIATVVINETGQVLSGTSLTSNPLIPGTYTATITWACGCDPDIITFTDDCCDEFVLSQCDRDCEGNVVGCQNDPGVMYLTATSSFIPNLYDYVSGLPASEPIFVTASRGNCVNQVLSRPPVSDDCCRNFSISFTQDPLDDTKGTITVFNGDGPSVSSSDNSITITANGDSTWSVSGLTPGSPVTFTATDSLCGDETANVVPGVCSISVDTQAIDSEVCEVVAVLDQEQTCDCPQPTVQSSVTSVKQSGEFYKVSWKAEYKPTDADLLSGQVSLKYKDRFGVEQTVTQTTTLNGTLDTNGFALLASGSANVAKNAAITTDQCQSTAVSHRLTSGTFEFTLGTGSISNGLGLTDQITTSNGLVTITSISVKAGGSTLSPNGNNVFSRSGFSAGQTPTVQVDIVGDDGNTYNILFTVPALVEGGQVNSTENLCQGGAVSNSPVDFTIVYSSFATEDSCFYNNSETLFKVSDGNSNPSTPQSSLLTAVNPSARDVKFTWTKSDSGLEYVDFDEVSSTVTLSQQVDGENFLQQGAEYRVTASCPPCEDSTTFVYCCLPEVDLVVSNCNTRSTFTLTGLAGDYIIIYNRYDNYDFPSTSGLPGDDGIFQVTIPVTNVPYSFAIEDLNNPILSATGTLRPVGVPNCVRNFVGNYAESDCDYNVYSEGICSSDEFTIIVDGNTNNCPTIASINVTGGSSNTPALQSGNTWVISGVAKTPEFTFDIVDVNGCTYSYDGDSYTNICETPSPTPSPTAPSPTPSPTASPVTVITQSPTPSPTLSPSGTPSPTASPTPSPTASPTASPTLSPSGTPSPTPSPTASPTSSPTASPTPAPVCGSEAFSTSTTNFSIACQGEGYIFNLGTQSFEMDACCSSLTDVDLTWEIRNPGGSLILSGTVSSFTTTSIGGGRIRVNSIVPNQIYAICPTNPGTFTLDLDWLVTSSCGIDSAFSDSDTLNLNSGNQCCQALCDGQPYDPTQFTCCGVIGPLD